MNDLCVVPAKVNQMLNMQSGDTIQIESYPFEDVKPVDTELDKILMQSKVSDVVNTASLGQVHFFISLRELRGPALIGSTQFRLIVLWRRSLVLELYQVKF